MKKNIKTKPTKVILGLLKQYNFVLFIIIVVSGLIYAVLSLTNILIQPTDNSLTPTTSVLVDNSNNNTVFDQKTIDNINKLKASADNTADQTLPEGRNNPFSE